MKVKDYMKKSPITIEENSTLEKAVKKMVEDKTNTLVVINSKEKNEPVGILSSLCLIKQVIPDYLEDNPSVSGYEREGQLTCFSLKYKDEKIKNFMLNLSHKLNQNDTMVEATAWASKSVTRTLPVVNEGNELVGIIDRTCIKHAIYDALFNTDNPNCDVAY